MTAKRTLGLVTLAVIGVALAVPHAAALRAARPMRLELLAPAPVPFPSDGALVLTDRVSDRPGNREPRAVRLAGPDGADVRLRIEELAPSLYRLAPARRLARGRHTLRGVGNATTLSASGRAGPRPPVPDVVSVLRTRRTVTAPAGRGREGERTFELERVMVTLRAIPAGAVAIFARWPDWHDDEGGRYGAWAMLPAGATSIAIACTAEDACGCGPGHIPRPGERGELRFIDAAGRVSDPSPSFVVE